MFGQGPPPKGEGVSHGFAYMKFQFEVTFEEVDVEVRLGIKSCFAYVGPLVPALYLCGFLFSFLMFIPKPFYFFLFFF